MHTRKDPHPIFYLKQRASFWVASLSLFTFLIGNMMGQHGWYGFWASVLGQEDLSAIAYVGTVSPFEHVVDYGCWAEYGGDYKVHTFRQSPEICRRTMPQYTTSSSRDAIFSMQYMSSYAQTTEGTGNHPGVDIRVPTGTPIRAVMTGKVQKIGNQSRGFGKYVVLVHPNVPDPDSPNGSTTTLYSNYAHVSSFYVEEGDIVHKGDIIALSGNTGQSTGPHLDFSVVREDVPFLPFYPSNQNEGYEYSVNPMLYVQSDYEPAIDKSTVVARSERRSRRADQPQDVVAPRRVATSFRDRAHSVVAVPDPTPAQSQRTIIARLQSRRESRIRQRLAQRNSRQTVALRTGLTQAASDPVVVTARREVAAEQTVVTNQTGKVSTVEISHDGYFSGRGWEKVTIRLLDSDGNTVINPNLDTDLVLRAEFGTAEFRPSMISSLDFVEGEVTVNMLPRGRRTVVVKVMPFNVVSRPMQFDR
ncbi:MAG: M23 family metallopeptidase [Candidatus Peribacteraceae bacterium]|nr:M23 family metallopeptidase [Candidatus Peribacteraceae bacterium]